MNIARKILDLPGIVRIVHTLPVIATEDSSLITEHLRVFIFVLLLATVPYAIATEQPAIGPIDFARKFVENGKVSQQWVSNTTHKEVWSNNTFNWYYNPTDQPSYLSDWQVVEAMKTATQRWAQMCNISFNYLGITPVQANLTQSGYDSINVIQFSKMPVWINTSAAYTQWYVTNGRIVDADIVLSTSRVWDSTTLDAILTHEVGHAIGLAHSRAPESIMFSAPYHPEPYLRTLRGDDAAGCADLYGASPNALTNRILNWAEESYSSVLKSTAEPTNFYAGYTYRYYGQSEVYLGSKDGVAYYLGVDGVLQEIGPLSQFNARAAAAGF